MTYSPDAGTDSHDVGVFAIHNCDSDYTIENNTLNDVRVCDGNGSSTTGEWSGEDLFCEGKV